jgi:hypothetical protein
MLDVELWGLAAQAHRVTSLVLHLANVVLLFLVIRLLTGSGVRSWVVAALFALHPMHAESPTQASLVLQALALPCAQAAAVPASLVLYARSSDVEGIRDARFLLLLVTGRFQRAGVPSAVGPTPGEAMVVLVP